MTPVASSMASAECVATAVPELTTSASTGTTTKRAFVILTCARDHRDETIALSPPVIRPPIRGYWGMACLLDLRTSPAGGDVARTGRESPGEGGWRARAPERRSSDGP